MCAFRKIAWVEGEGSGLARSFTILEGEHLLPPFISTHVPYLPITHSYFTYGRHYLEQNSR